MQYLLYANCFITVYNCSQSWRSSAGDHLVTAVLRAVRTLLVSPHTIPVREGQSLSNSSRAAQCVRGRGGSQNSVFLTLRPVDPISQENRQRGSGLGRRQWREPLTSIWPGEEWRQCLKPGLGCVCVPGQGEASKRQDL